MKKTIKRLSVAVIMSMLFFVSCTEDDGNAGPTDDREKFVGQWEVAETCNKANYTVNISVDPSASNQILIYNFAQVGGDKFAYALVSGDNIVIESQVIDPDDGWEASGAGGYSNNGIVMTYELIIGGDAETCTATFFKQ